MYKKKRKIVPIGPAEREGYALVSARQWRSTIKSKAQVRRRARGLQYAVKPDDSEYVPKVKIKRWERWQFPTDRLRVNIPQIAVEEWRYYMPKKLSKFNPPKPEKKIPTDKDAPRLIADFLLSLTKIEDIADNL